MNSKEIMFNWDKLMGYVDDCSEGEQKDNIMKLYDHFEDRIIDAPASSKPNYHNCFAGGYLDHVVRIIDTGLAMKRNFESLNVKVTASDADIILACMFHDLGKLGDLDNPYYILQTDQWRRDKLNEWYTWNPDLEPMSVTDRALWLLQHFEIKVSAEVWKAIKLSDGMFDEGNQSLYKRPDTNRNILHYIVHFADWMSTVAEKQHWMQGNEVDEDEEYKPLPDEKNHVDPAMVKKKDKTSMTDKDIDDMKKKFDDLFKD